MSCNMRSACREKARREAVVDLLYGCQREAAVEEAGGLVRGGASRAQRDGVRDPLDEAAVLAQRHHGKPACMHASLDIRLGEEDQFARLIRR